MLYRQIWRIRNFLLILFIPFIGKSYFIPQFGIKKLFSCRRNKLFRFSILNLRKPIEKILFFLCFHLELFINLCFFLIPSETVNKFECFHISKWKEEFYFCLFALPNGKREYILFINASLSSWEDFFFFIFRWIEPLSHKKLFSFHLQINDRVAFWLLSYPELAYTFYPTSDV